MQPANLPLDIYRGDSQRLRIKLFDQQNNPIDLTQVTPRAEIRDRPAGTQITPLICTVTLPNIIEVFLTAAASRVLPANGAWDLQLNYSSGEVKTPLAGQVKVTPDVTGSSDDPVVMPSG